MQSQPTLYENVLKAIASLVCGVVGFVSTFSGYIGARYAAVQVVLLAGAYAVPASAQMTPAEAQALGNQTGRDEKANVKLPSSSGTDVTLHSNNPTVNNTTFSIQQLFQGSADSGNSALLSSGRSNFGNWAGMSVESSNQTSGLMNPTNSSPWANAYRTLRDSTVTNSGVKADMRGDPALSNTRAIASGTDPNNFLGSMDATCTTTSYTNPSTTEVRLPDIRTCDRYTGPSGCVVTRAVEPTCSSAVVFSANGWLYDTQFVGMTLAVATGNGSYVAFGLEDTISLTFGVSGLSVVVQHFPTSANEVTVTASAAPGNATADCTYSVSGGISFGPSAQITQQPSSANGWVLGVGLLNNTNSVAGYSFSVTQTCGSSAPTATEDFPPGCSTSTNCSAAPTGWTSSGSPADELSNDKWACTEVVNTCSVADAGGGGFINAVASLVGLQFASAGGTDSLIRLALLEVEPTDPIGGGAGSYACARYEARNYVCTVPNADPRDTCGHLTTNPQCNFVRSECLPENYDEGAGQCMFLTDTYDCGTTTQVDSSSSGKVTTCSGPIRCMGESCIEEPPAEVNEDFSTAAMQLSVAEWSAMDKNCTSETDCVLFTGEGHTCKVVFWGVQDCCDQPTGVNMADYIRMTYYTYKVSNRQAILQAMDSLGLDASGAWAELSNWASNTYDTLSEPIVSAWDSLASDTPLSSMGSPTDAITEALQYVQDELRQWTIDTFGTEVGESLFGALGSPADFLTSEIGSIISVIGTVYMYYRLFVLAVQIIYECEEQELQLAFKRDLRACHYLGRYCAKKVLGICYMRADSYCCFKSPFSRIIQEQVRKQIIGWPPAGPNPECRGLSVAELQSVNWSLVDLSEWLAILQTATLMPTGSASADGMYSADNLSRYGTQSGKVGSTTGDNASQALASAQPSDTNEAVRQQLWSGLP